MFHVSEALERGHGDVFDAVEVGLVAVFDVEISVDFSGGGEEGGLVVVVFFGGGGRGDQKGDKDVRVEKKNRRGGKTILSEIGVGLEKLRNVR